VFAAVMAEQAGGTPFQAGVRVTGVVESGAPPRMEYMPGHPLANEEGYVFFPGINMVEEMANMMSASRNFQNNVEMMNTVQQLMLRTLQLGQR
jgi:flagellar basal-body rod protein FlgC